MAKGAAIKYTEAELEWCKKHRKMKRSIAYAEFCKKFNRTDVSLNNYNALCKRKGWHTGRNGRFTEGHTPHNKGTEMAYHPNSAKTQFKKGHTPHNTKYLGHERITKDGYIEISVDEVNPRTGFKRRYVLKHKHLWEEKFGKLPDDMCLKCIDDNRQNTDPSNWEAIPRGALPFLNGCNGHNYRNTPAELKPSVLTLAKTKHALSNATKTMK